MMWLYLLAVSLISSYQVVMSDDLPCAARQMEFGLVCVCNSTYCDTVARPSPLPRGQFYHYSTSQDSPGFSRTTGTFSEQPADNYSFLFTVNRSIQYQEIIGLGGAFTDSSGMAILSLPTGAQDKLVESYFSTDGIEHSMARVPIGGSDFSTRYYTYDDNPDDAELSNFSLADEDYQYKIPILQRAVNASPHDFKLMGSSFTSPTWMKTNNKYSSGYVKKEFFHQWAKYHIKFFDAYAKEGLKYWSITSGNEVVIPLMFEQPFAINMAALPMDQRHWVHYHLGPQLMASNHSHIRLAVLDDERSFIHYWMSRFVADQVANQFVEGVAIHWYWDWLTPATMLDDFHKAFPDKLIFYTETSINVVQYPGQPVELGSWFRGAVYIWNIIENLNHWTNAYLDWNIALNTDGGPYLQLPLDAAVITNSTSGESYKNPMFYGLGHFSKFMPPGSRRINVQATNLTSYSTPKPLFGPERSSRFVSRKAQKASVSDGPQYTTVLPTLPPFPAVTLPKTVAYIASTNPDNSTSVILFNTEDVPVTVRIEDLTLGSFTTTLAAQSVNTFLYWPDN